jgi:predicted RNA-binding protein
MSGRKARAPGCSPARGKRREAMCEARVYLSRGDSEELYFEDVAVIRPSADGWLLTDIFGQTRTVAGEIKLLDLVNHKVVFAAKPD